MGCQPETQYDGRKNLNKSVSELVQETFQGKVFSTNPAIGRITVSESWRMREK